MTQLRCTIDGSPELEARIALLCQQTAQAILGIVPRAQVDGLLLGGGYGRGEGGVLRTPSGEEPYNDLEFYLLLKGSRFLNERRYAERIHTRMAELSGPAGLDIEVKILSLRALEQSSPTMFFYDLVMGHRVVLGEPSILARCAHMRQPAAIPRAEAARLLMNRCAGLLFAKERLQRSVFAPEDADFTGRNLAKAQLGFGDAILAAAGQYHWSCLERHKRLDKAEFLQSAAWYPELLQEHQTGVEFKLHPHRASGPPSAFQEKHARLAQLGWEVWRWIETARLQTDFSTARQYARPDLDKCPETSRVKNLLVNARQSGLPKLSTRYPRERLFNSLALLLWGGSGGFQEAARELDCRTDSLPALVREYERLWQRFN